MTSGGVTDAYVSTGNREDESESSRSELRYRSPIWGIAP